MKVAIGLEVTMVKEEKVLSVIKNIVTKNDANYFDGKIIDIDELLIEVNKDNNETKVANKNQIFIKSLFKRLRFTLKPSLQNIHVISSFIEKPAWMVILDEDEILVLDGILLKKMRCDVPKTIEIIGRYGKTTFYKIGEKGISLRDEGVTQNDYMNQIAKVKGQIASQKRDKKASPNTTKQKESSLTSK